MCASLETITGLMRRIYRVELSQIPLRTVRTRIHVDTMRAARMSPATVWKHESSSTIKMVAGSAHETALAFVDKGLAAAFIAMKPLRFDDLAANGVTDQAGD